MASTSRVLAVATSRSGASLRLTQTQWSHIIVTRPLLEKFRQEMILTVEEPDDLYIPLEQTGGELHAVRRIPRLREVGLSDNLVVVYREVNPREGFIITAFPMSDKRKVRRYRGWRRLYP